jgi:hypothetical protein
MKNLFPLKIDQLWVDPDQSFAKYADGHTYEAVIYRYLFQIFR